MEFVYSLSYEGEVFYIGRCKSIHKRYMQHHCLFNSNYPINHFMMRLANIKECATLGIIGYFTEEEAKYLEMRVIHLMVARGRKLFNIVHNPESNRLSWGKPDKLSRFGEMLRPYNLSIKTLELKYTHGKDNEHSGVC